jgi:hypothetical protein
MQPAFELKRRFPCLSLCLLLAASQYGCAEADSDADESTPVPPAGSTVASAPASDHSHADHATTSDVDLSALPQGWKGASSLLVRATSEQAMPSDVGAFRTSCALSHMNSDDAIVYPGQPGRAHLHAYFGNTGTNAYSNAESLKNSGNSTCRGGIANRSAYWVPAVLDKRAAPVKPANAQVYYKTGYNGIAPRDIQLFPEGLRMIAGDAKANVPGQEHAFWGCEKYTGHASAIPDCPTGEVVIMTVIFPQCWNGVDLDSTDHKGHMAYPVNGACPSTHPRAIPEISFQIRYDVPPGTRSSEWRLSSDLYGADRAGGYSAHGDWFEGWKREIAEAFVKNCDQTSRDCHSSLLGDGREIYSDDLDSAQGLHP